MMIEVNDIFEELSSRVRQLETRVRKQERVIRALRDCRHVLFGEGACRRELKTLEKELKELDKEEEEIIEKKKRCLECRREFSNELGLKLHSNKCGKQLLLKCDSNECEFQTEKRELMRRHKQVEHNESVFGCQWCPEKRFRSAKSADNHRRSHHQASSPQFECPEEECQFRTRFKHRLDVHLNIHNNVKPFKCEWPGCEFSTAYNDKLKFHRHRHTGEKSFRCEWPQCDQLFREKSHVKVHMRKHTREKPFECELCSQGFQTKQSMELHKKRRHQRREENKFI